MVVPKIIIVDEDGPEEGADIRASCMVTRKKNLTLLIEGLSLFMPYIEFKIYTKEEYATHTAKKKTDPNI